MRRRTFLQNLAVSCIASSLPTYKLAMHTSPNNVLSQPALLQIIDDVTEVTNIGQAYTHLYPEQRFQEALTDLLQQRLGENQSDLTAHRIEEQIRDDFAGGDTILLRGWVLARTEAMQCALFSLT